MDELVDRGEVADDEQGSSISDLNKVKSESKKRKRKDVPKLDDAENDSNDEEWLPERRSKRLQAKNSERLEERNRLIKLGIIRGEKFWKEFEKKTLLNTCKEFGSKEVDKIIERIPTKTPEHIKAFLQRERKHLNYTIESRFVESDGSSIVLDDGEKGKIRRQSNTDLPDATPQGQIVEILKRRERSAPIEKWIDIIEKRHTEEERKLKGNNSEQVNDYSCVIPSVLRWIADFEDHPDPSECGGIDYAAIYRYLATLCEGEAPPDLNKETSKRVSKLLPMMNQILKQMNLEKETNFLENYRGVHSKYRWDPSFDYKSKECVNLIELGKVPGMNPLNFHPEMFTKKIPKLDEIIEVISEETVENFVESDSDLRTKPENRPEIGIIPKL